MAAKSGGRGNAADVKASADEVQANFDEINDQGYFGERVDPTPLDNYTVSGVIAGKPTPETDAQAAARAAEATNTPPQVTG
ncbi:hypothetical protein [Micromonospora robiginosa]|uniref:Uncharacterized protein n=1 Tax=Micromonospora robiginosa TaxID=2749844 RepID=A0A7L6B7U9_9ACTN|nr:hypothetical protein [Micromonospora ferruginea]QLQ37984.1 hypothetical protein H1D33_03570 [Micromonospora ferruginea]